MKQLREQLEFLIQQSNTDSSAIKQIEKDLSVFPFTTEVRILSYLLSANAISYKQYVELGNEYIQRNRYLELFEMAPRTFGETWGEKHILSLFPQFVKATKETVSSQCPNFDGEFDLWLDGIRVEVKACRANSNSGKGNLASRAYLHSEAVANGFKYHYQQLKPSCCDVFIWIGVCKDILIYWILTSHELLQLGKLGPQHRNENTGASESSVFEGQVFMTEEELQPYLVNESDILAVVRKKC